MAIQPKQGCAIAVVLALSELVLGSLELSTSAGVQAACLILVVSFLQNLAAGKQKQNSKAKCCIGLASHAKAVQGWIAANHQIVTAMVVLPAVLLLGRALRLAGCP